MSIVIEAKVFAKTSIPAQHPSVDVFVGDGYTLVGGGARIEYQEPGNLLQQSYPIQGASGNWTGWRVYGKDCWVASMAKITAYAIGIKVTKDGEPVALEQRVFKELGDKASVPSTEEGEGWTPVGGGAKCDQNIYENVLLSESSPQSDDAGLLSHWTAAKQYCPSPTSSGGPSGGGSLATFLIAIRAAGIKFQTKLHHVDSEVSSRPLEEVSAPSGTVVSGGVMIKEGQSCWTSSAKEDISFLTSSYPSFETPEAIKGWIAAAKDHNVSSPVAIRTSVIALSGE